MSHLPQYHPAHQQEKASISKLASILPQDLFILRAEDGGDYGVDRILEVVDEGVVTNVRSHIQVKSIKRNPQKDGSVKYPVPLKSVNYLLNTVNSIFLVYSASEETFYWDWTRQIALAADRKGINLRKPPQKTLTFQFTQALTQEAFGLICSKLLESNALLRRIGLDRGSLRESYVPKEDSPGLYSELLLLYLQEKYESVIGLFRGSPTDDVPASNLVALSYYHTRNYREALKTNAKTLARSPSDKQAQRVLAMILCEKGIENHNTELIKRAKETMLGLDRGEWGCDDFYNYGNILSALGEYIDAIAHYEIALEINPDGPMAWKNMATCYFYQKDHQQGMKCLDRALELDESLIEALISKANTLRDVYSEPQQAADLLKKALELSDIDYFDNSVIYYWLAKSLSDAGDPHQALAAIDQGQMVHPGNESLEAMRLAVLVEHWRNSEGLSDHAVHSLSVAIEKRPKAFPLRTELVKIYAGQGKSREAYFLILETFWELNFDCADEVLYRFPVSDLAALVSRLGDYLEFRAKNNSDAGFFENFDIHTTTLQKIELVFAIKFANLLDIVVPGRQEDALLGELDGYIAEFRSTTETCSELITEGCKDASVGEQSELIAQLVLALPELVLRELTRQIGWLLTTRGYGAKVADRMIRESKHIGGWFSETVEPVLKGVHNVIGWSEKTDPRQTSRG